MHLYIIRQYIRRLSRRKLFSFINITGLAFGIAFILMIGQFLFYEFNYNHELKNVDNIYRLVNAKEKSYMIDYRIKDQILGNIPGIENVCLLNDFEIDVNVIDKYFKIKNMVIVDSSFFNVFNVKFLSGNPNTALATLNGVVLTESTAKRIFGTTDVIGKTILLAHKDNMTVTGVVKDLSDNLSFKAEIFVSYVNSLKERLTYTEGTFDKYKVFPFNIFIVLKENANNSSIKKEISAFYKINKFSYPEEASLLALKTNYFETRFRDSQLEHGNIGLVKLLIAIGVIILLLAIINFINLSTAAYYYRLKELGVKKCFGANRKSLIHQLLAESFLTCFISAIIGIGLVEIFLPYFNQFVDKPMTLRVFTDYRMFSLFLVFIPILSFISGLLPALILSKITPVQLFKSTQYLKGKGKYHRGILTMFQFAVTIILVLSLIVIYKQINFVKHSDIGFNTDHLVDLKVDYTLKDKIRVLSDKLSEYHGTKSLSKTLGVPGEINLVMNGYSVIVIDSATLKTFGFKLLKGRNLLPGDAGKACLINEEALKKLKSKSANGKVDNVAGNQIVGVVADFHYSSLYNKTGPLILLLNPIWNANNITIRVTGPIGRAVDYIKSIWKEVCPDYPLELGFYDESFAAMYSKEERLATLLGILSIIAVIISCMGIFGLSVYQSEQRIKEIGIRKVLGAKVSEIILLLVKNFSKWVIFANLIAIPVGYYLLNEWLQDFAYRINISWWMFLIAGVIALFIAISTVSLQAIKAATTDPVKTLRYE